MQKIFFVFMALMFLVFCLINDALLQTKLGNSPDWNGKQDRLLKKLLFYFDPVFDDAV